MEGNDATAAALRARLNDGRSSATDAGRAEIVLNEEEKADLRSLGSLH